jgi:hydroxyquinol 1,2-dioxygenase
MSQFDDRALTKQVLEHYANTPDPRRKTLITELVLSLHEFVCKTNLTFEEWDFAIDFLTRTGQKCTATRQEFILLSDVLGVSMLVDAVHHRSRDDATEATVLGPFYAGEHKPMLHGSDISVEVPGAPMFVNARVTGRNEPLSNVPVDVWQADDDGFYDSQMPSYETQGASLRARFITAPDGRFSFRTILPCSYSIPTDGPVGQLLAATSRHLMRPAHVHFVVNAAGFEPLITHPRVHRGRRVSELRRRLRRQGRTRLQGRTSRRSCHAGRPPRVRALVCDELRVSREAWHRPCPAAATGGGRGMNDPQTCRNRRKPRLLSLRRMLSWGRSLRHSPAGDWNHSRN